MNTAVSDDVATPTIAEVENELYGAAPADFIERRDRAARSARDHGHPDLAKAISSLRKPTNAAWAIDSFARDRQDEIASLLDVGDRLRAAVQRGDGGDIRRQMHERAASVTAVIDMIRAHARQRGHPLSDSVAAQIGRTLRAAMASDEHADALRRGVLDRALDEPGLQSMDGVDVPAANRTRDRRKDDTGDDGALDAQRIARAERAVEQLRGELAAATAQRVAAEAHRRELRDQLHELDESVRERQAAESDADERFRDARSELRAARTKARRRSP